MPQYRNGTAAINQRPAQGAVSIPSDMCMAAAGDAPAQSITASVSQRTVMDDFMIFSSSFTLPGALFQPIRLPSVCLLRIHCHKLTLTGRNGKLPLTGQRHTPDIVKRF